MTIHELETPSLLIDLDVVERNLKRWQAFCDQHNIRNRPHIKTHKLPQLAHWQLETGAVGITCQKLGEVEIMADAGIDDIFLTYNIIGREKLNRLAALHQRIRLRTIADSQQIVDGLAEAVSHSGKPLTVFVECETGMQRIGVPTPAAAADLAAGIARTDALEFGGFSTYPTTREAVTFMNEAVSRCRQQGLEVPEISGGGTPGMWNLPEYTGFTEHRAGTYIYNDRIIAATKASDPGDCAMTVLATVISTAGADWVTIDGGTKTFSSDQYGQHGFGVVSGDPECVLERCTEEHGMLVRNHGKPRYRLGDRVRVVPNHACVVSNLHETACAVRGDKVVAIWPIAARGKLQ